MESFGPDLEKLAAEYAKHRAAAMNAAERVRTVESSATSSSGLVTVTVDGQGEIRTLLFNSQEYRRMAPAELAHTILDTVSKARKRAFAEVTGGMPAESFGGVSYNDIVSGTVDWDQVLPEQIDMNGFKLPNER